MVGKNEIVFCHAQMTEALEYYLRAEFLREDKVIVTSVEEEKDTITELSKFRLKIEIPEELSDEVK